MVVESGSSSEMVIMKPTELKAMNIYISILLIYDRVVIVMSNINSAWGQSAGGSRRGHMTATPPLPPERGYRVDKMHISPPPD